MPKTATPVDPKHVEAALALPLHQRAAASLVSRFGWTEWQARRVIQCMSEDQRCPSGRKPANRDVAADYATMMRMPRNKRSLRCVQEVLTCGLKHARSIVAMLKPDEVPDPLDVQIRALKCEAMTALQLARATGFSMQQVRSALAQIGRTCLEPEWVIRNRTILREGLKAPHLVASPAGTCPLTGRPILSKRFSPRWVASAQRKERLCRPQAQPVPTSGAGQHADALLTAAHTEANLRALLALVAFEGGGFADIVPPAADARQAVLIDPRGPRSHDLFSSAGSPAAACAEVVA